MKSFAFVAVLRGVLAYYSVALALLSIQSSHSQSQEDNTTNETVIDPSCTSSENRPCHELPAVCISCDFFDTDGLPKCTYNENTIFNCQPLPEVMCEVCSMFPCILVVLKNKKELFSFLNSHLTVYLISRRSLCQYSFTNVLYTNPIYIFPLPERATYHIHAVNFSLTG